MLKTERGCRINHRILRSIDDSSFSPPSLIARARGEEPREVVWGLWKTRGRTSNAPRNASVRRR